MHKNISLLKAYKSKQVFSHSDLYIEDIMVTSGQKYCNGIDWALIHSRPRIHLMMNFDVTLVGLKQHHLGMILTRGATHICCMFQSSSAIKFKVKGQFEIFLQSTVKLVYLFDVLGQGPKFYQ